MIAGMREPVDQFGRRLRELRKARGMTADKLSRQIGGYKTLAGNLEREHRAVSRQVLHKIADALDLSPAQHQELLRLAALRQVPDDLKDQFAPPSDPDSNLLTALLEIDHEWPSEPPEPNPRSERAQLLLDAMAWLLAERTQWRKDILVPFTGIRWPEPLVRLGIVGDGCVSREVNARGEARHPIDIPESLLREELPFVDQLKEPITPLDGATQSRGMARVYRRLLFSDPDRARAVVGTLEHWAYDRTQQTAERIDFRFVDTARRPSYPSPEYDIGCRVISIAQERRLAFSLWHMDLAIEKFGTPPPWYCQWDPADWVALQTIGFVDRTNVQQWQHRQRVRDAWYMLLHGFSSVLESMREEFGVELGSEPELEEELKACELSPEMKQRVMAAPWRLAAIEDDHVLKRYLYVLHSMAESLDWKEHLASLGPLTKASTKRKPRKAAKGKNKKPTKRKRK